MVLMYIGEDESVKFFFDYHLSLLGFKIIQYKNPLKAIDNIEEVLPDVVIFSAIDFPRHWKTFLQVYRQYLDRDKGLFLLSVGDTFSSEEAAKAEHLNVSGILNNSLLNKDDIEQLMGILVRYNKIDEKRTFNRYTPGEGDEIDFVFTHPWNMALIAGEVKNISLDTISIKTDNPLQISDLRPGMALKECSMTIGEDFFVADCEILRNKNQLTLKFINIDDKYPSTLIDYVDKRAERQLKLIVHNN